MIDSTTLETPTRPVTRARLVGVLGAITLAAMVGGCADSQPTATPLPLTVAPTAPASGAFDPFGIPCRQQPENSAQPEDSAQPTEPTWRAGPPDSNRTPVPADFVAVVVRRCALATVLEPGDGEWQTRLEQEATTGLTALVDALRQPSASRNPDQPCPAIGYVPVELTLTDAAGRTITPAVPQDSCGQPARAVLDAVSALPWRTVKQSKVGRVRTQLEIETGCPGDFKPVVALDAENLGDSSPTGRTFDGHRPTELRICRYAVKPEAPAGKIGDLPVGSLESAGTLTGAGLTGLLDAVNAAPPVTASCAVAQAPFALLRPVDASAAWLVVELGGCHRSTDDRGRLRQLDPETVAVLTG